MENRSFYITPLQLNDADKLNEFMSANVKRFIIYLPNTLAKNLKIETSKAYILAQQQQKEDKLDYTFVLKDINTNSIIGLIILKNIDWKKGKGEFAYCVDKNEESKGIMSSAIQQLSQYPFEKLNLKTLQIITHKTNIGSSKVASNSSFIWVKTLKNEYAPPNAPTLDMELYELQHER